MIYWPTSITPADYLVSVNLPECVLKVRNVYTKLRLSNVFLIKTSLIKYIWKTTKADLTIHGLDCIEVLSTSLALLTKSKKFDGKNTQINQVQHTRQSIYSISMYSVFSVIHT